MIADTRIKSYTDTGVFKKDDAPIQIGRQMKYEMEQDYKAIKYAIQLLREHFGDLINDKDEFIKEHKGSDSFLMGVLQTLKARL